MHYKNDSKTGWVLSEIICIKVVEVMMMINASTSVGGGEQAARIDKCCEFVIQRV